MPVVINNKPGNIRPSGSTPPRQDETRDLALVKRIAAAVLLIAAVIALWTGYKIANPDWSAGNQSAAELRAGQRRGADLMMKSYEEQKRLNAEHVAGSHPTGQ